MPNSTNSRNLRSLVHVQSVTVNVCVYEHGREEIVIVGADPLFKNLNLGQVQSMLPFESMSITFTGC